MESNLTRRAALHAMAGLGAGLTAFGCGTGSERAGPAAPPISCVLTPEQMEGPYFFDTGLLRRDITEGALGLPLRLEVWLASVVGGACTPLAGVVVETWHADADGVYSGYDVAAGNLRDATGETFLRGYQVSDDRGRVEFSTIYPGWYPIRTTHIHLTVRLNSTQQITTQIYFPESINDIVMAQAPYDARGPRPTTNANDRMPLSELADLTCDVAKRGRGYRASFSFGVGGA